MADRNHKRLTAEGGLDRNLEAVVTFLDPHLAARSRARHFQKQGQWPLRKTLVFILFASLFLWGLIIASVWFLIAHLF